LVFVQDLRTSRFVLHLCIAINVEATQLRMKDPTGWRLTLPKRKRSKFSRRSSRQGALHDEENAQRHDQHPAFHERVYLKPPHFEALRFCDSSGTGSPEVSVMLGRKSDGSKLPPLAHFLRAHPKQKKALLHRWVGVGAGLSPLPFRKTSETWFQISNISSRFSGLGFVFCVSVACCVLLVSRCFAFLSCFGFQASGFNKRVSFVRGWLFLNFQKLDFPVRRYYT